MTPPVMAYGSPIVYTDPRGGVFSGLLKRQLPAGGADLFVVRGAMLWQVAGVPYSTAKPGSVQARGHWREA